MAPSSDDRDRNFEKALASHVQATSQAETSSASPSCADLEALAAYHEGALSPEQRNLWKAHIQACSRCQEILAQLQATDAIPLDLPDHSEKQKSVRVPVLKPRTPSLWRWAAPAGALAAGLLVWVTVRENKPLQVPKPATSSAPIAAPKPPEPEAKTQSTTTIPSEANSSAGTKVSGAVRRNPEPNRSAEFAPAPSKPASAIRERTAEDSANLNAGAPPQPEVGDRADAVKKDLKEKVPASRLSAAAPAPAPAPEAPIKIPAVSETVTVESGSPAPLQTTNSATANPSDQFALQQKQDLPLSGRSYNQLVAVANNLGARIIAAPHGPAQWRIGAAGIVEHSSDAGATWTLQSTGVVADLLAGSATSDKVCWLVGRAGTILRTTDGGAHWSKVPPPIVDDFASVFAVNARQATISPAHGTYQTKDAGSTWKKLAPE
jgi:hypothetical protein